LNHRHLVSKTSALSAELQGHNYHKHKFEFISNTKCVRLACMEIIKPNGKAANHNEISYQDERFNRLFILIDEAVTLELRLKKIMIELESEVKIAVSSGVSNVLMAIVKQTSVRPLQVDTVHPGALEKGPGIMKVGRPSHILPTLKERIVGLMADKKVRKGKVIMKQLRLKKSGAMYSALTSLVKNGRLVRTKFAHYRKA
jgi:hypothetical protein